MEENRWEALGVEPKGDSGFGQHACTGLCRVLTNKRKGTHHLISTAQILDDVVYKEGIPFSGVTVHMSVFTCEIDGLL